MARNVTLSALRDAVRFQADVIGASLRHTDAQLTTLINTSIQGFREEISNDGNTHYLVASSGTLSTGATSPYSFQSLDLSAISPSIVRTYGLDVTVDGIVHSLDHRPFTERNIWSGPATTGIPRHWAHYQTAKLAIQPAPNSAYAYTLWYLPVLADLSADGDTFNGVSGWEDWIVWDVVCRLLIRDQQAAAYSIAKTYRDDVWSRIKRQATRVSSAGGAVVGRDTLRGRIPDPLAARQPLMAGGGSPATHSIVLSMLSEQTGPVFLGRIVGTGDVQAMTPTESASILPVFTPSAAGFVPAAGGSSTSLFLTQAGTFEAAAGGGGGGTPGGPTGSIQIRGLSGFVGLTGFSVQGAPPSMIMRLPGSLRVTGGSVDVGSGTVRMSASGIDMGGGQLANVSSLFAFPTFAAGVPGLVPASDQDSSKFLNAAGGFAVPPGTGGGSTPGGSVGEFQFNNGVGGFGGASGVRVSASGLGLSIDSHVSFGAEGGNPAQGTIRFGSGASNPGMIGINPSGAQQTVMLWQPNGFVGQTMPALTLGRVAGSIGLVRNEVATGGMFSWQVGHSGFYARLLPTGFDLSQFHVNAKSLALASGVANDTLAQMASGTVKTALTLGAPADVQIPTLAAFFPTFTSARAGLVPTSDGDSNKFLNAVGAFAVPPGLGGSSPTGVLNSQLADMPSGTVKARLTGTGAAQDVLIPTLFMYAPTFTANRAGLVPTSDGDSTKFLNAVGAFAVPPGTGGGSPTGVTNAQLEDMPTGTVKARLSGTGAAQNVPIATLLAFAPTFTDLRAGVVPPSGGGLVNFLRADGNFAAPTGFTFTPTGLPNANLAVMPSGTVKANLTGTGAPADVLIPTLFMYAPTMTSARAGIVGPGGGNLANFLRGDGAFAAPTGFVSTPTGLPNANLSVMPSGTVKANLTGTGAPADVLIPTLMMHFPTFTSARAGIVAPGDGDTGKFLNAAGAFATPVAAATPGGDPGNVQWNNAGAMAGMSGAHAVAGGAALALGPAALVADRGDLRVASGFMLAARNPSGIAQPLLDAFGGGSGVFRIGGSGLPLMSNDVASGGVQRFSFGGATATTAQLTPTGLDASNFHIKAKSLDVGHINGLPFDFNGLKRGIDISSFVVGGTGNAIPSGVQLYLPRGAGSGANRYIIPSGIVGTGTQAAPQFITLNPTGGKGGGVIRIEKLCNSGSTLEVRTPTGTVLHSFPSGTKGWGDFMFEKPSGAVFQLAGHADMF